MALRLGTLTPSKLYFGASEITRAYLGTIEVYSSGAPAWTPAALGSALALWLDADDASTITLKGSTVSQWRDKSGNARHANQTVAANQPAYTTAGLNGKNVLTFDGANDLMELSSGILLDDNFTHVHSVLGRATTGINSADVGRTTTPQGYGSWWFSDNFLYSLLRGTSFMSHGGSTATGTFINGLVRNNSGTQAYRNGSAFGVPQGAAATANVTLNAIGRAQGGSVGFHNGQMAEVIVGRSDLSTDDRQKLEGYLAWKWGLQANLPSNHPYRYDGTLFGYYKLWTPAEITTALWLDAADPSTITLNGSTVSQWRDRSENGRHFTQATGANQPTYSASGLNGGPALTFNGSSTFMSAGDTLDARTSNITIMAVARYATSNQPGVLIGKTRFSATTGRYFLMRAPTPIAPFVTGTQYATMNGQGSASAAAQSLDASTDAGLFGGEWNRAVSTGYTRVWRNGIATATTAYAGDTDDYNTTDQLWIGAYQSGTGAPPPIAGSYLNGQMSEMVVTLSTLSTADRQKLEGYLAWKWGTVASLPSDHPYKNGAPTV